MNRTREVWLQRAMLSLSGLLLLAAGALLVLAFTQKEEEFAEAPSPQTADSSTRVSAAEAQNPALQKLAQARMSRTVTEKATASAKPVAPPLESLIRVKGIMDYGNPKTNEAIIEDVRSGRSQTYKTGEHLQEVDAVVKQIDSAVILEYDGKTVRMEMRSGERSEFKPMASPNQELRTASEGEPIHTP